MLLQSCRISLAWTIVSICLLAGGVSLVRAADDGMRTWSDAKGKFKIKAKFRSLENGVVTLEKEDGSELEIDVKKLSAADQKFATDAAKADDDNPFKSKEEDPFKSTPKNSKSKSTGKKTGAAGRSGEAPTVKANLSSADVVTLSAPGDWAVEVPKPAAGTAFKPKTAQLPPKTNFFEGIKGIAPNLAAKKAAVGIISAPPGGQASSRVVICDLASGKSGKGGSIPGSMVPLALHDDGEQVVMRREDFGFGNQDRLEVWTIQGSKAEKNTIWTPYEEMQGAERDVLWAEFLDADTLATSSRHGRVVLWKFPEIEPLCTFNMGVDGATPALSPDRRLIAYLTSTDVGLFDVTKREVIAQEPIADKLLWPNLAFSPSGKRLGCVCNDKIVVWDVATGKLERTVPADGLVIHGRIDFVGDDYVLANGKYLFDVANQLKLWTYDGQESVRSAGGWTFFGTTDGEKKPGALVAAEIPHPAANSLLKKALSDPSLFVLKAGTTVKINTSGIRDASQQARVQESLTKRLQAIGCSAGANGTIELVASVDGPKPRKVSFRGSGEYNMQEYFSKVQFVYQGTAAWETGSTNVPGMLMLKAGENVGTALKEREKPDYGFFDRVELPKFLQKPSGQGPKQGSLTLGQSKLTTSGIQ